jgi:DNA-binding response OmpR family regulator
MHKILVVGANKSTADMLDRASRQLECEFSLVGPDQDQIAQHMDKRPDFVVIDEIETDLDTDNLCSWLRKDHEDLLIMLLSREGTKLTEGSHINVHLVQPFTSRKLSNRIKKLLSIRRTQTLAVGEFVLDPEKRRVSHLGKTVRLTPKEYRLLELLARHATQVLSRRQIMKEVWETDYLGDTRTLDVHIRWLREKIEDKPHTPVYLRTVRRVGYVFDPTEPDAEDREASPRPQ